MKHTAGKKMNYAMLLWNRNRPITGAEFEEWFAKFGAVKRAKLRHHFNKQGGKCIYCGKDCLLVEDHPDAPKAVQATTEHIIPVSKGGTDAIRNLAMSCSPCNSRRGNLDHEVFLETGQKQRFPVSSSARIYHPDETDLLESAKVKMFGLKQRSRIGRAKRAAKPEKIAERNAAVLASAVAMIKLPAYSALVEAILGTPYDEIEESIKEHARVKQEIRSQFQGPVMPKPKKDKRPKWVQRKEARKASKTEGN